MSLPTSELDSLGLLENSRNWSFNRWLSEKDTWEDFMIRKYASAPRAGAFNLRAGLEGSVNLQARVLMNPDPGALAAFNLK